MKNTKIQFILKRGTQGKSAAEYFTAAAAI
jgi:hypothetical protein